MTPQEALQEAQSGKLRPVYLVAGEEPYLIAEVVTELQRAALAGSPAGLNEDQLSAADVDVEHVLAAARTLPMMARRRLVTLRGLERWETATAPESAVPQDETGRGKKKPAETPWDKLGSYAEHPNPSTVLILMTSKLDKRRRFVAGAIKGGWLVTCDPLTRQQLPGWITKRAAARNYKLSPGLDDLIAELAGPELASVSDALERVGLYAGVGATVTENDVAECLVKVRPTTVWELVAAVGKRDIGAALSSLAQVYDPQDRGLRLVGVLAWSARQMLRFESALRGGASPPDAAKAAGAPPFKARQLAEEVKRMPRRDIERWLETLASIDLALKGGSRRPALAILETAIIDLCAQAS